MTRITIFVVLLLLSAASCLAAEQPARQARPAIYDRTADGNKQIEEALKTAKAENKHVLLQFGANWCGWCHKLHAAFQDNAELAKTLKDNYLVVLIDVDQVDGKMHNQDVVRRYGNPTQFGLPVIVVLDKEGKQLMTQDTAKLEEDDHHDPKKVMEFLNRWKPSTTGKS